MKNALKNCYNETSLFYLNVRENFFAAAKKELGGETKNVINHRITDDAHDFIEKENSYSGCIHADTASALLNGNTFLAQFVF